MCGFTGIWNFDGKPVDVTCLVAMNTTIRHRGPDDEGYLMANTANHEAFLYHGDETITEIRSSSVHIRESKQANLGIGFRRLSIIDLSATGHQPMQDESGRYCIVLNGEIYNYIEIRAELIIAGFTFRSQSDTEVVLKAFIHWGKECLNRFNGMWAFVIYDSRENRLFGARDRFGIKPFYYHYEPGKRFIFASEIKAILQIIDPTVDPFSILQLFTTSYMDHSHHTFFRDIIQLKPSHYLEISENRISIDRYYRINIQETKIDFNNASEKFLHILKDSVRIRMRSDVPIGFALSGGLDSSSIIALARDLYPSYDINAFSLVYPGKSVDESFYIRKVTEKLSVRQFAVSPTAEDLLESLDKFVWHQEEPNNGSSYWGEFKLRELIKKSGVTVSLEGQGADEIITGYPFFIDPYLSDLLAEFKFTSFIREANAFRYLDNKSITKHLEAFIRTVRRKKKDGHLKSLPEYLNLDYFSGIITHDETVPAVFSESRLNKALHHALTISSVPAQLIRADKSSMAFSVECRFPFLDYRLVELAFSLPGNFKLREGVTKYILRESVLGLIPDEVYQRKDKIGFATPQKEWLSGALKTWMKDIVFSSSFTEVPFFNAALLNKELENNLSVIPDYRLWAIIMCYVWIQKFKVSVK